MRRPRFSRKTRPSARSTANFSREQTGHDRARWTPGCRAIEREIDARTDRDEEEPEEQTFEWLDVRFELHPVFAFREHHAGDERAERRREAELLHEQRDAHAR